MDLLRESYLELDKNKAVGIDGVTKGSYRADLGDNFRTLLSQVRCGVSFLSPPL